MFDTRDREKDDRLQRALDRINDRHGKRAVVHGIQVSAPKQEDDQPAIYKEDHKSPLYTTDWREIVTIKVK